VTDLNHWEARRDQETVVATAKRSKHRGLLRDLLATGDDERLQLDRAAVDRRSVAHGEQERRHEVVVVAGRAGVVTERERVERRLHVVLAVAVAVERVGENRRTAQLRDDHNRTQRSIGTSRRFNRSAI
jgi:hypothetical protein